MPQPVELPAVPRASVAISLRIVSSPYVPPRSTRFRLRRLLSSFSARPRGREPGPSPSARRPPPGEVSPPSPDLLGPSPLGFRHSPLLRVAPDPGHRQTRDSHLLAPSSIPGLLETEIAGRAAVRSYLGPTAHSRDGLR